MQRCAGVKPDMKRKTARELLADSFRELATTRAIDRITVQDIVKNCGYSTATFYRQFKDKYDLIAWDYSCRLGDLMHRLDREGYGWRDISLDGAKFYARQKDYLANLLLHTSGYDSFVRYMTEIHIRVLCECVQKAAGTNPLDEITRMYVALYCHGTIGLTCAWILGQYQASAAVLSEVYERSLPEPLYHILCEK